MAASRVHRSRSCRFSHSAPIGPSGWLACRSTVRASSAVADQAGLERADQREVEQSLGVGADRLLALASGLELGHESATVVQEREEPLHEGHGARGGLLTHGAAHGSREGRPVQCSAHAAPAASASAGA